MIYKALFTFIITNMVFAENDISVDLAYQLVLEKINKKAVPVSFLNDVFTSSSIEKHMEIPERFAKPYEKKSWEQYKKLFIKESRIVAGVKFYSENKDLIMQVAERYNVDPFIILSIAGIESNYGKHYKGFTVFNSLYTQIHEMPKRAKWASKELASYLEYCFKDNVDPQSIEGSYAGAFGFGQFIPSSFNRYSVDFDNDGVRRPHDWPDVLGSIANYLIKNGYIPGSSNYSKGGDIWKSVWAYNHSDNYVMAVLGLTEKIRKRSNYLHSNVENRLNYIIENFDPLDNRSVSDLQKALNANGYNLEIDGRLGGKTLDALRDAQSKRD
jgi:membrane-bound lytic murein transglycosylase B